jgi:hypothetical protein
MNEVDDKPVETYRQVRDSGLAESWLDVDNTDFRGIVRERGTRKVT